MDSKTGKVKEAKLECHYRAPEMTQGGYDQTADLWGLGLIAYKLWTKKDMFTQAVKKGSKSSWQIELEDDLSLSLLTFIYQTVDFRTKYRVTPIGLCRQLQSNKYDYSFKSHIESIHTAGLVPTSWLEKRIEIIRPELNMNRSVSSQSDKERTKVMYKFDAQPNNCECFLFDDNIHLLICKLFWLPRHFDH